MRQGLWAGPKELKRGKERMEVLCCGRSLCICSLWKERMGMPHFIASLILGD